MEIVNSFKSLYKNNTELAEQKIEEKQEERRKNFLQQQKLERAKIHDEDRSCLKQYIKHIKNVGKQKTTRNRDLLPESLQLSEWLQEKPNNLSNWFLVPCPKGVRCVVIACNNTTEVFNKRGKLMFYFRSKLPGCGYNFNESTILDCIYVSKLKKFFVLDAIVLGNHDLCHCEASFRCYWIKSRFSENSNYDDYDNQTDYSFTLIDWIDFEDEEAIAMNLMKFPYYEDNIPTLDGFLFYHKEASYTFGQTPLVGWLFPFMIPEVLGYSINENYMLLKPIPYIDYIHYINEFNKCHKKNNKNKIKCIEMKDASDNSIEDAEEILNDEMDGDDIIDSENLELLN